MDVLEIDVWSDIACPWCYIGKRKLEAGVAAFRAAHPGVEVAVTWHSYELVPDVPDDFDGSHTDFFVDLKGVSPEQARAMAANVTAIAAEVGLRYDFDALRPARTIKAHELLHHAKAHNRQGAMKERLLRAHFTEGRHLGRDDVLADLAAEIGLDRDDVLRSLREREHLPAVEADIAQGVAYGIRGVPFFVIEGRYGMSGAQPPETFAAALEQVYGERSAAPR
jgi:predicted DsbA family dithiol-disulfide isomerase